MKYLSIKLKILGHKWEVRFCTPRYFKKHRTTPCDAAVCDGDARRIYILKDQVTRATVSHELTHAHFVEMGGVATNLSEDQLEELYCEMWSRHGKDMLVQERAVHAAYRTLVRR